MSSSWLCSHLKSPSIRMTIPLNKRKISLKIFQTYLFSITRWNLSILLPHASELDVWRNGDKTYLEYNTPDIPAPSLERVSATPDP